MSPSRLGNGRPQDWPSEMRELARDVKARVREAGREGQPVVLDRQTARDLVTATKVGADSLEWKNGHVCREPDDEDELS